MKLPKLKNFIGRKGILSYLKHRKKYKRWRGIQAGKMAGKLLLEIERKGREIRRRK